MSGSYELLDTDAIYSYGRSIAWSESEARAAGESLLSALSEVSPGSDHDAGLLASAIGTFQIDCADARNAFANEVSVLGENTASGATTGVQVNNEDTRIANENTSLARSLNTQACRAPGY